MADQEKAKPASQGAGPGKQDLPSGHAKDPTETTLTQNDAPDERARLKAVDARLGVGAERDSTGTAGS